MLCPNCNLELEITTSNGTFQCPSCCKQLYIKNNSLSLYRSLGNYDNQSKIQLGTRGSYQGRSFIAVGEIQLSDLLYTWSEWVIQFDDFSYAWLSDFGSTFIIKFDLASLNSTLIESIFGAKALFYLTKLSELKPNLFMARLSFEDNYFSFSKRLTAKVSSIRGTLPIFPENNEQQITFTNNDSDQMFAYSSLTNTYLICDTVNEYSLFLYNFREMNDYFHLAGGKKFRLYSFNCPECSVANPRVISQTVITYCIGCSCVLDPKPKNPFKLFNPQFPLAFDTDILCGSIGTIGGEQFIVLGIVLYTNNVSEYYLYSKIDKNKTIILRKILDQWFFLYQEPLTFTTNFEELFLLEETPIDCNVSLITGSLPYLIEPNSYFKHYLVEDFFYTEFFVKSGQSVIFYKSNYTKVLPLRLGNNFKFKFF